MNLFADNDLYDDDSYASNADWKIEKEPEIDLKKIKFDINVNEDEIDDLNNKDVVYLKDDLADDNNTDIEDSGVHHKQDDKHNRFCAPVENKLQLSHQIGCQNETND